MGVYHVYTNTRLELSKEVANKLERSCSLEHDIYKMFRYWHLLLAA